MFNLFTTHPIDKTQKTMRGSATNMPQPSESNSNQPKILRIKNNKQVQTTIVFILQFSKYKAWHLLKCSNVVSSYLL